MGRLLPMSIFTVWDSILRRIGIPQAIMRCARRLSAFRVRAFSAMTLATTTRRLAPRDTYQQALAAALMSLQRLLLTLSGATTVEHCRRQPGIATVPDACGSSDNRVYNLQGQRVVNPSHGVYIRGGKKILIK